MMNWELATTVAWVHRDYIWDLQIKKIVRKLAELSNFETREESLNKLT